ncbi:unnamed protein product [Oppiella nova]|uniref:Lipase domain-containing protein n=1 Tax=Oppiella nova TaxID=334625 RepID=A0A7R9M6Z7_9ACAR|nr:unnamed protein product [Oppiella nova]CAG2170644.1 unnamed protein product [Oppiella nova]
MRTPSEDANQEFPDDWDLQFILFTRDNRENPNLTILPFNASDSDIKSTSFDPQKETKFITHGWISGFNITDSSGVLWMRNMTNVILDQLDGNVFCVDWSKVASDVLYFPVVPNTQVVGQMIGYFINRLVNATNASLNDIHLIGHSMGAHVMGFAGQSLAPNKVSHISGLDPAGPGFGDGDPRLSRNDANLVVCTHTSSGIDYEGDISIVGLLGNKASLGHYDFRLNGGNYQPACGELIKKNTKNTCNTNIIAYNCQDLDDFNAGKCASLAQPLELDLKYYDNTDNKLNQTNPPNEMFIQTSASYDYCLFHYQIVIEVSKKPLLGEIIEITLYGQIETKIEMTLNLGPNEQIYTNLHVMDQELGVVTNAKVTSLGLGSDSISTIQVNFMSDIDSNLVKELRLREVSPTVSPKPQESVLRFNCYKSSTFISPTRERRHLSQWEVVFVVNVRQTKQRIAMNGHTISAGMLQMKHNSVDGSDEIQERRHQHYVAHSHQS